MRCDANVSIRREEKDPFGTKVEIKNIGSISNVALSIEKEIIRQQKLYDNNETFKEQTRRFDSKLNDTVLMRIKETGNDYRYFPEPDIPYLYLTNEDIEKVKEEIPLLPDERRKLYEEKKMSKINTEKIIAHRELSDFLNEFLNTSIDFQTASNLLLGDISSYLNKENCSLKDTKLTKEKFTDLVDKTFSRELTSKNVKELLTDILEREISLDELMKEKNISNITDDAILKEIIARVIEKNEESVTDYLNGHDRALKYLMGQVMKETKGSADPSLASKLLQEELSSKK